MLSLAEIRDRAPRSLPPNPAAQLPGDRTARPFATAQLPGDTAPQPSAAAQPSAPAQPTAVTQPSPPAEPTGNAAAQRPAAALLPAAPDGPVGLADVIDFPAGGGNRLARRNWRHLTGSEAGMATAEYAIATLAAVAFAGLLVLILRSGEVRGMLTDLVELALRAV